MKRKFVVRAYDATAWSLFTKADHYKDYHFSTDETLEELAKRVCKDGFLGDHRTWIAPGAIVFVREL